jgi:hypothetical protein
MREIGRMNFDGVEKAFKLLILVAIVSVPLALWKILDILRFLVS